MDRGAKGARRTLRSPLPEAVVGLWTVIVAGLVILGADLLWVVAMGDAVRREGGIPGAIPFASAPQIDWPNPVVLAELVLSAVDDLGWWGLPALHLALVAGTLLVLVSDARRLGAREGRTALVVTLAVIGCSAPFVVVRFPSLSLVPFVALVWLLRREADRPSRAIWLVPPLVVLWGNLHGAVLVGIAVLGVFVVAGRGHRFLTRAAVGLLSLSALVLTSAGLRTPLYYFDALRNEAAARGTDLWAAPSFNNPLDLALLLCGAVLLLLAARSLTRWEWLVVLGTAAGTVDAARHGVWLLLFLAPVAAARTRRGAASEDLGRPLPYGRSARLALAVVIVLTVGLGGAQLGRRDEEVRPPGYALVPELRRIAGDRPVLAVEPAAETFARDGITLWAANPLDAFTRETQAGFLDFLHDCRVPDPSIAVIVVKDRCESVLAEAGWRVETRSHDLVVLSKLT
ncbi:hypothetical protein [Oryzobacter telluris]|uniref:hypothetical protein n=1 Tax=Oryzobacter telluris TaxID=3149179 RepID=UPI00370D0909